MFDSLQRTNKLAETGLDEKSIDLTWNDTLFARMIDRQVPIIVEAYCAI